MGKTVYFEKPDMTQQISKNEDTEKTNKHMFFFGISLGWEIFLLWR